MMPWDHKEDLFNAQKVNYKKERKLYILSLFMKLMLLIQELKDFKFYFQEKLVKLNKKLEIKLMVKWLNGEKKEKLKLFLVSYL